MEIRRIGSINILELKAIQIVIKTTPLSQCPGEGRSGHWGKFWQYKSLWGGNFGG